MREQERIVAKLAQCRPYYERLLELRPALAEGKADWVVWSAVERNLQLALECALDVGEMLIAWKGLPRPERYRDVFRVLGEAGLVEPALAARLARAAGLRNLLVRAYGELDRELVRRAVMEDLGDLDPFARAVAAAVEVG